MSSSGSTVDLQGPPAYIPFDYPARQTINSTTTPLLDDIPPTAALGIPQMLEWFRSNVAGNPYNLPDHLLDRHYLGPKEVHEWSKSEKQQARQYALAALGHTLKRLPNLTVEEALATNAFSSGLPGHGQWRSAALIDHAVYVDWLVQQRQGSSTMPTFLTTYRGEVYPGLESVRDVAKEHARLLGVKDLRPLLCPENDRSVRTKIMALRTELYPDSERDWDASMLTKWNQVTMSRMLAVKDCLPDLTFDELVGSEGSRSFGHGNEDEWGDRHWLRVVAEVDEVRRRQRAEERSLTADCTHGAPERGSSAAPSSLFLP